MVRVTVIWAVPVETGLPYWSCRWITMAVGEIVPAVKDWLVPAVKTSLVAPAGFTVMPVWEPVMVLVTVSVAVIDCVPAVFKVTLNEPTPLIRLVFAGKTAWLSLEVILTVPV